MTPLRTLLEIVKLISWRPVGTVVLFSCLLDGIAFAQSLTEESQLSRNFLSASLEHSVLSLTGAICNGRRRPQNGFLSLF